MNDSLFFKIKEAVTQWLQDNKLKFENRNIVIETVENNEECLYVIINFEECMAAIVVAIPDFAPYRYVSLEAVDIVNDMHKTVYAWYDDDETTIDDVIENLNRAINIVAEYSTSKSKTSI